MKSINVELFLYTLGFQSMFSQALGFYRAGSVAAWGLNTTSSTAALVFVCLEVEVCYHIVFAKKLPVTGLDSQKTKTKAPQNSGN